MEHLDGVTAQEWSQRSRPAQALERGTGGAAQGDDEACRVVAVHLDGFAKLPVEPEGHNRGHVPVDMQLPALTEPLRVLNGEGVQPEAIGEPVDDLIDGIVDVEPKGRSCCDTLGHDGRGRVIDRLHAVA
jgi:hypothetical protein